MIRKGTHEDFEEIFNIINDASMAYKEVIPPDCWHEPYMTREELRTQIEDGVRFSCFVDNDEIIGVMGIQDKTDVELIRHAYVRTKQRNKGVGTLLLRELIDNSSKPILIGTWKAANWAIAFYEKHGFSLVDEEEKDRLLRKYWAIPDRQVETSVVLVDDKYQRPKGSARKLVMEADYIPGNDKNDNIVVFSILKPSKCSDCGTELHKNSFLRMEQQKPLCLECADLDHLVFLPRGDVALTRRSRKYSGLSAVVVKFSRTRRRYERQGLLVEPAALERTAIECAGDETEREIARARAATARERVDREYVSQFANQIRSRYPGCPIEEAESIANHACQKYSGRVGRSAAAKVFEAEAIELAVRAHVRHAHTEYDRLLSRGWNRADARSSIAQKLIQVLTEWSRS